MNTETTYTYDEARELLKRELISKVREHIKNIISTNDLNKADAHYLHVLISNLQNDYR